MHPFFDPILNKFRSKDNSSGASNSFISLKKSLTAAQLKTGQSIPVACGISVPVGKFIRVISAVCSYTANDGALSLATINIQTVTGNVVRLVIQGIDPTIDSVSDMIISANPGGIIVGEDVVISTNANSASGTGTADIYMLYELVDK